MGSGTVTSTVSSYGSSGDGCYTLYMHDSYGDGWHGNMFTIDGQSFTIESGSWGEEQVCIDPGCYDVTLDGGPWQEEISWDFAGIEGGAPYYDQICVGGAESGTSEGTGDGDAYTLYMHDSYGDGWHGNLFTINGESYTFDYGYGEEAELYLEDGCYEVTLDGGPW